MTNNAARDERYRERFVRWQGNARNQLTVAVAAVFTANLAGAGYCATQLAKAVVAENAVIQYAARSALVFFGVSLLSVVLLQVMRSLDASFTAKKIRKKWTEGRQAHTDDIDDAIRAFGRATWALFWLSVGAQLVAVFHLARCFLS